MSSSAYQTCFIDVPLKAAYKTCILDFLSTRKHRVRLRGSRIDLADWSVKMIDNWPPVLVDSNQTGWILSRAAEGASARLSPFGSNPFNTFQISQESLESNQKHDDHLTTRQRRRLHTEIHLFIWSVKYVLCYHNLLTWSLQTCIIIEYQMYWADQNMF